MGDTSHQVYIGEGEDISHRIKSHDTRKGWWETAVFITSTADNLNKAHVKYLEARLVEEAVKIGRSILENGNSPMRPSLTEAAQSNMESFLDNVLMVLPALSIDTFLRKTRPSPEVTSIGSSEKQSPIFEINSDKLGLLAKAELSDGEFVVQAGSFARERWEGTPTHNYKKLYDELVQQNVLEPGDRVRVFSSNYAFSSLSAAGAMVFGRACNGQTAWKVEGSKKTYREWETEMLNQD